MTRFKVAENICMIFSLPDLSTFVQRSHMIKWVDWTFPKPKGKFFMEIILSLKYSWKHNRFSIVIVNMWNSKWMTYLDLLFDVTDGHGLKWCIKMDKLFVLIYLSPCFIKLGVVRLCIFCVSYTNYLSRMKMNSSVYNAHLDFRGMQAFCVVLQKKCCSDHPLV